MKFCVVFQDKKKIFYYKIPKAARFESHLVNNILFFNETNMQKKIQSNMHAKPTQGNLKIWPLCAAVLYIQV